MRLIQRRMIEMEQGLTVCGEAATVAEALDAVEALDELPRVILADWMLGEESGMELIEAVGSRWPQIACIILSGYPRYKFEASALAAGAVAYVEKGNDDAMIAALHEAAGGN